MSQANVIVMATLMAFLLFIIARGELQTYLRLLI